MTISVTRFLSSLDRAKEHPLLCSLALNVVFFFLFLCMGEWHFSSLDDLFMSSVLTGAYGGQYDVHMFFVNAAYGYVLKPLYLLFPEVGWYSLGQVFETFAAFVAIVYGMLVLLPGLWAWGISILVLTCVLPCFWPDFAFTQCAAVLSAAGILLGCLSLLKNKKCFAVLASLFFVTSFIMRKEMLLLGLPTLALSLLFCWLKVRRVYFRQLLILLCGVTAIVGLYFFNASLYKMEGYDYYAAYQGPRAFFGDGKFYDSEAAFDEFNERDMCGADIRTLRAWYFYDKSAFSLDSLQSKIQIVKRSAYDVNYFKMPLVLFLAISRSFLNTNAWCWLGLSFVFILGCSGYRKFIPWASLGLLGVSYVYMLIVNRIVDHVEVGAWLYAIVFLISFLDDKAFVKTKLMEYILAIVFVFAMGAIFVRLWNELPSFEGRDLVSAKERPSKWLDFERYAAAHPEDVFLLAYEPYKEFGSDYIPPHKSVRPGAWNNVFSLGYWNINLLSMEKELIKRGVENPMRDVIRNNVFVIENDRAMLPYYFREHYHESIVADTVMLFDDMALLKYRIEGGYEKD